MNNFGLNRFENDANIYGQTDNITIEVQKDESNLKND